MSTKTEFVGCRHNFYGEHPNKYTLPGVSFFDSSAYYRCEKTL